MYRGYSISKNDIERFFYEIDYQNGGVVDNFSNYFQRISVEKFFHKMENGLLDAQKIQDDWFPEINTHVFISHSHADIELAKKFARWLSNKFGIISFIDSCVWGYADDLLKKLDNKYCKDPTGKTYNYEQRNLSTAHVHMLLMTALNKMIDKSECVFFINTPNSNISNGGNPITMSPWIYGEIETSRLIQKNKPNRIPFSLRKGGIILENLKLGYSLNMGHFYHLNHRDLSNWCSQYTRIFANDTNHKYPLPALDILYNITPKKAII